MKLSRVTLNGDLNPQIILRPHPYSADLLQPAPNFGFAWNPAQIDHGNLVVRGGASITHYDEDWSMFEQATEYSNPGDYQDAYLNAGPTTNTPAGEFPAGSLSLGGTIPSLNIFPQSFTFPQPESGSTFGNQPFATVDPSIRSPYIENWYVGIQKKLPTNTVLEVNYVGNHSVHMWQVFDMNEVNIFENGFLQEFLNAQSNYAASGGATFAGAAPLPISELAPPGQQGTCMGFAFLPIGIGSLIGGWFGGRLLHRFGEVVHQPARIWWIVTAVGMATAALLWIYDKIVRKDSKALTV